MTRSQIDYGWPDQRLDVVTGFRGSETVNCHHRRYTPNQLPRVVVIWAALCTCQSYYMRVDGLRSMLIPLSGGVRELSSKGALGGSNMFCLGGAKSMLMEGGANP